MAEVANTDAYMKVEHRVKVLYFKEQQSGTVIWRGSSWQLLSALPSTDPEFPYAYAVKVKGRNHRFRIRNDIF